MLFENLKVGEEFEVYGDIHLNYNYPAICKCVKVNDTTGKEIDGINFAMDGKDEVHISNKKKSVISCPQEADMTGAEIKTNMDNAVKGLEVVQTNSKYLTEAISSLKNLIEFTDLCSKTKETVAAFESMIALIKEQHNANEKEFSKYQNEIKILQSNCPHESWSYSGRDSHYFWERCDACKIERKE